MACTTHAVLDQGAAAVQGNMEPRKPCHLQLCRLDCRQRQLSLQLCQLLSGVPLVPLPGQAAAAGSGCRPLRIAQQLEILVKWQRQAM